MLVLSSLEQAGAAKLFNYVFGIQPQLPMRCRERLHRTVAHWQAVSHAERVADWECIGHRRGRPVDMVGRWVCMTRASR